jgi:hypothetical protein
MNLEFKIGHTDRLLAYSITLPPLHVPTSLLQYINAHDLVQLQLDDMN